jgi:hypothetical protein
MKGAHFHDVQHINSTPACPKRTSRMFTSTEEENGEICTGNWDYFEENKT